MKMALKRLTLPAVALALSLALALAAALHIGAIPIPVSVPAPVAAPAAEAQNDARYQQFTFDRLYDATLPHAGYEAGDTMRLPPCEIDLATTDDVYCTARTEQAQVTLKNGGAGSQHYRAYVTTGRAARPGDEDQYHARVQAIYRVDMPLGRPGVSEYRGSLSGSSQRVIDLNGDMATQNCFWYSPGSGIGGTKASLCSTVYIFIYKGSSPVGQQVSDAGLPDLDASHIMAQVYFQQEPDMDISAIFLGAVRFDGSGNVGDCAEEVACSQTSDDFVRRDRNNAPHTSRVNLRGFYNPTIEWQRDAGLDRAVNLTGRWLPEYPVPERARPQTFPADNPSGVKFELDLRDGNSIGYFEPGGRTAMRIDFAAGSNLEDGVGSYEVEIPNRPRDIRSEPYYHHWRGWNAEGPMRGTLSVAYHHPDGRVYEMQPFTLYVKGPPARVDVPGSKVTTGGSGSQSVYANYQALDGMGHQLLNGDILQDNDGSKVEQEWQSVRWTAADEATRAVIGNGGSANGGSISIPIQDDAPAGEYTVNLVSAVNSAATGSFTFTVPEASAMPDGTPAPPGPPASYAITGPDRVAPGGYATYTVTATDANGGVPNLAGDNGVATVAISGEDGAVVDGARLLYVSNGRISLDGRGVGYFRLRVAPDAGGGSISIAAVNVAGDASGGKIVVIGTGTTAGTAAQ